MSSFKLGISILWPACWTALPIKMAFALLFMAMGAIHIETTLGVTFLMLLMSPVSAFAYFVISAAVGFHFAEGTGLPLLFILSIPIDIWAMGLVARTFFLEQLRLEPPASLGLGLWVKFAIAGAIYLPLVWVIEGGVTDIARSTVKSILDMEALKHLPVAERIGVEFTTWGSVSLIALVALTFIGLSILGKLVQASAAKAQPAGGSYQGLISRWDMLRVPADQGLMLTAFTAAGAVLSVLFWSVLPVSTPHPQECCKPPEETAIAHFDPPEIAQYGREILKGCGAEDCGIGTAGCRGRKRQIEGRERQSWCQRGRCQARGEGFAISSGKTGGKRQMTSWRMTR